MSDIKISQQSINECEYFISDFSLFYKSFYNDKISTIIIDRCYCQSNFLLYLDKYFTVIKLEGI